MIADQLTDDNRERSFSDFNSFSQVNHALYSYLNPILWKEAAENDDAASFISIVSSLRQKYLLPIV
jgi:hypothetical protein